MKEVRMNEGGTSEAGVSEVRMKDSGEQESEMNESGMSVVGPIAPPSPPLSARSQVTTPLALDLSDARMSYAFGMTYREIGRIDSAVAAFERATSDPEVAAPAALMLGEIHATLGEYAKAILALERGMEAPNLSPPLGRAMLYELANAQEHAGNFQAALASFEILMDGADAGDARGTIADRITRLRALTSHNIRFDSSDER